MYQGYADQQCTGQAGAGVIQSIETCVKIREAMPRCLEMFKKECRDRSVALVYPSTKCPVDTFFLPFDPGRFDVLSCGAAVDL
jgi:hypothetical protein